jgi:hypothetical protein
MKNIQKSFGDVRVLNGVNLRLERGFAYTLKGGNGSGFLDSSNVGTIWNILPSRKMYYMQLYNTRYAIVKYIIMIKLNGEELRIFRSYRQVGGLCNGQDEINLNVK